MVVEVHLRGHLHCVSRPPPFFSLISLASHHRRRRRRPPPLPFLADPPLSCEVLVLLTSPLPFIPAPPLILLSPHPSPIPCGYRPAATPAGSSFCRPLCLLLLFLSLLFSSGFSGASWSPALCREVASWLLTTPQGIPQVARASVISWLEKPFRLECERPVTPPPRSQDFQHRECSQPSPNAGPSVLQESHLGPAPMLARLGAPI